MNKIPPASPITQALNNPLYKQSYAKQKYNATQRNIPFELSFEQWLYIWLVSGKIKKRGIHGDEYCMARHGDKGAYSTDNVSIVPMWKNVRDGNLGQKKSREHRIKLQKVLEGIRKRIPVSVNGVVFDSLSECSSALGCCPQTIKKRCTSDKAKYSGWIMDGHPKPLTKERNEEIYRELVEDSSHIKPYKGE